MFTNHLSPTTSQGRMLINLTADHRITALHPEMVLLHVSSLGIILRFIMVFIVSLAATASRFKAVSSLVTGVATACVTPELPLFVLGGKEFPIVSVQNRGVTRLHHTLVVDVNRYWCRYQCCDRTRLRSFLELVSISSWNYTFILS